MHSLENRLKEIEQMRVLDMHAHLSCLEEDNKSKLCEDAMIALGKEELALRREHGVATFFSCGTPREWEVLERVAEKTAEIMGSFGIHPWYSDQYEPEKYMKLFRQCDAIGEIGMDSVWCKVPLKVQQEQFVKQLELAADLKKPVILHTKGQEAELAKLVRDFPEKICVHWYSGDVESFERFLELGCYFTLGPDACLRMLRDIPAERLFVETDGISAVAWAKGTEHLALDEIPIILERNLQLAAVQKGMKEQAMRDRMWQNLREFLS